MCSQRINRTLPSGQRSHLAGVRLQPTADLARLRARQGNAPLARDLITEAVNQGGLGVTLAASEVYLAVGETAQGARHVLPAYTEAWTYGPPYIPALELERPRVALKVLHIPEPALPPFDPTKVIPVPQEAEIRAFIFSEKLRNEQEQKAARDWSPVIIPGSDPRRRPRRVL